MIKNHSFALILAQAVLNVILMWLLVQRTGMFDHQHYQLLLENCANNGNNHSLVTRVGILVAATGNYASITKMFIGSARRHMFSRPQEKLLYKVIYFIFTDQPDFVASGPDVVVVKQNRLGWPGDSLFRNEIYLNNSKLFTDLVSKVLNTDTCRLFVFFALVPYEIEVIYT